MVEHVWSIWNHQNCYSYPIGSMYGIYANIWGILMVNVTIYGIHGSYVLNMNVVEWFWTWTCYTCCILPLPFRLLGKWKAAHDFGKPLGPTREGPRTPAVSQWREPYGFTNLFEPQMSGDFLDQKPKVFGRRRFSVWFRWFHVWNIFMLITWKETNRWMEEILHQLIGCFSHYL